MTLEERVALLEEKVARWEMGHPIYPLVPYTPIAPRPLDPGVCLYCGGRHGVLPCPACTPMMENYRQCGSAFRCETPPMSFSVKLSGGTLRATACCYDGVCWLPRESACFISDKPKI